MANRWGSYPAEIEKRLHNSVHNRLKETKIAGSGASAVLFLLSENRKGELSLVLTKRSALVSQPGDLCSPGGRVSPVRDRLISRLLLLPGMPLKSWKTWKNIRKQDRKTAESAAMLGICRFEGDLGRNRPQSLPGEALWNTGTATADCL